MIKNVGTYWKRLKINMATEVDQKNSIETNPKYKEFKSLLDEDFKIRNFVKMK